MTFSVSDFRTKLNGGARANLFEVTIAGAPVTLTNANLLCKAAAIPGFTIGMIEVPFRGRRIKVPGDRTFAEWTVTFISDPTMRLRAGFEDWLKAIKDTDYTSATQSSTAPYFSTINVSHMNDRGSNIATYKLIDAFPTDVSQIDLSYDSTDAIEEFTVTFQYHYLQ
jgi:hypothetical protein